ncbi:MAG: TIGR00180 family glycosyltransferase [Candidatus Omnitrophica bacterium]|nr:TIGR00180 family glycosyltransferase [Candidatus Omnitrophota bacterium]
MHSPGGGLSDKLTVLMPTRNRYSRLRRVISYMDSVGFPFRVHILDSSDTPDDMNIPLSMLQRNHSIRTLFDTKTTLQDRILSGLEKVSTPYTVFWADDDFMVLSTLNEGIEFLDAHRDYSVVHGMTCLFNAGMTPDGPAVRWISYYGQRSIQDSKPSERLRNHLRNCMPTAYSIHRTDEYKRNLMWCCSRNLHLNVGELALSGLSVIQGKSGMLNKLYLAREAHDNQGSALLYGTGEEVPKHESSEEIMATEKYTKLADCFAQEIAGRENISQERAGEIARDAVKDYINTAFISTRNRRNGGIPAMKKRAKDFIRNNGITGRTIMPLHRFLKSKIYSRDSIGLHAFLDPQSPYHDDFMPIYRSITDPKTNCYSGMAADKKGALR